jgi:succinate dehydrogenase/fumarate reductase-like Fe-S protein
MADPKFGALEDGQTITLTVRRTPPAPELERYEVEVLAGMSVFNVLERIRDTIDPSLAIPISCRIGKCDICFVRVNGRVRWACTEPATDDMLLEPAPRYVVLKDLVVDLDKRIKGDGAAPGAESEVVAGE